MLSNSASLAPCELSKEYTGLSFGEHTYKVVATNLLGGKTVKTYSWSVGAPPVNEVAPKAEAAKEYEGIVGNEDELSCNKGTWKGAEPLEYSYQWEKNASLTEVPAETNGAEWVPVNGGKS